MIKNYLKVTVRNLFKNKVYSIINIVGLAIGMSGSLLISMYVANEMSYENFHQNRHRIYRISLGFGNSDGKMKMAGVMPALGPALLETIPEVENVVRFYSDRGASISYNEITSTENRCMFADPAIFDIFSFTLKSGDKNSVLTEPLTMVLTERMARKYFGTSDPVGQIMMYDDEYPMQITGVMEDVPANTHIKFDGLISYASLETMQRSVQSPWNNFGNCFTYILMHENTTPVGLMEHIKQLLSTNTSQQFADMFDFYVLPLSEIHLSSGFMGDLEAAGNRSFIILFSVVSVLVLVIACFNFMNLSTARSLKRMKEIGVRKVLGANRLQLMKQFLTESMLIAIASILLGLVLFELFYPTLNSFIGSTLDVEHQNYGYLFLFIPVILIVVGLIAGSYPALHYSRNSSIDCLRTDTMIHSGKSFSRRFLVVAQFVISIVLIAVTVTVFQQLRYMIDADLGFDKDNVVLIYIPWDQKEGNQKYSVIKEELLQYPNINSVSGLYVVPGINSRERRGVRLEGTEEDQFIMLQAASVDRGFIDVLGLELLSGRDFSDGETFSIILNEAAVTNLNIQNPIGKTLGVSREDGMEDATIIGVVKDFHLYSKQEDIEPLMMYINPEYYNMIGVRIEPNDAASTLAYMEDKWKQIDPESSFQYSFLDETYQKLYRSEERIGQLFTVFSLLAILIASLGLFGLASFMTERRTKEIGIRKVLGATISNIIAMISREFVVLVVISGIIAIPIAYYFMNKWLDNFAYHITISVGVFLLATILALCIALLTVSFQAMKAALANPVKSLRYE